MARVTVFVDDAVRGELPPVCVKTGRPATRKLWFHGNVGGSGLLSLLLVFLGPVGWALLLFGSARTERIDVLLPVSDETLVVWHERRRDRGIAIGTTIGLLVLTVALAQRYGDLGALPFMLIGGGVLGTFVAHWRLDMAGVDVDLDASRRWVVLGGVHPDFVDAVHAAGAERRTPR